MKEKTKNPETFEEWYERLEPEEIKRLQDFAEIIFEYTDEEFEEWLQS